MILSNIKENGPADCTPSTHLTADPFLHGDELCGVFLLQDDAVLVVSARVGDVNLQAVEHGVTCNNDSIVKISYFLAEHQTPIIFNL